MPIKVASVNRDAHSISETTGIPASNNATTVVAVLGIPGLLTTISDSSNCASVWPFSSNATPISLKVFLFSGEIEWLSETNTDQFWRTPRMADPNPLIPEPNMESFCCMCYYLNFIRAKVAKTNTTVMSQKRKVILLSGIPFF